MSILEENELYELKDKMMKNPNLFTAGLIVAQTELALQEQSQHFEDKIDELEEENADNKIKWVYRYELIDWLEKIAKDFIAGYTINRTDAVIKVYIERTKHNMAYGEFPYMKKGEHYRYAGDHYICESFDHKLIDNVATVVLILTKEEETKNEEN